MTWGSGPWGSSSPWGTGSSAPPPTLISASPYVVERRGGTVVLLLGTNFQAPMTVEVLRAGLVVGEGYINDVRHDLRPNKVFVGMPALDDGVYDLRVTTDGGSATGVGLIEARLHSEEYKVVSHRAKWAEVWNIGERYLG